MYQVMEKIKVTRLHLLKWVKNTECSILGEIMATEDKLQALFGKPFTEQLLLNDMICILVYTHYWDKKGRFGVNGPKRISCILGFKIPDIFIKKHLNNDEMGCTVCLMKQGSGM